MNTATSHPGPRPRGGFFWITWALVALSVVWCVAVGPLLHVVGPAPLFAMAIPFTLLHGWRRYGGAGLAVYYVAALVISNLLENCSILTGFPFGHYHYTAGPKLFHVPVMIGPAYVAIGYLSWQVANALLHQADTRMKKGPEVVLLPMVAAAVMTMFDLATDPQASTLTSRWVWEQGGGYFGVPYTNFLGWWFVTYLFFQVFALYLRRRAPSVAQEPTRVHLLQSVILYFNLGLTVVVDFVTGSSGQGAMTDLAGHVWHTADVRSAMFVVFVFTGAFVSVLAVLQLYGIVGASRPPERQER